MADFGTVLFLLLGQYVFDAARQVIKVNIAFDRANELCSGQVSKEERRLMTIMIVQRVLVCVALAP